MGSTSITTTICGMTSTVVNQYFTLSKVDSLISGQALSCQPTRKISTHDRDSNIDRNRATEDRAFRRSDRRGRNLRGRRCLSPHHTVSGDELCRPRNAGKLWRYVAHPPLSRHPVRQRSLYLWLSLQAMDQCADRDCCGNPALYGRSHRRERPRPAHSLSAPDLLGTLVEQRQSLDDRGDPDGQRRDGPFRRELFVDV